MDGNMILDKDEMLKKFDGDKEFLATIVEIFINDIPEQLSGIKGALVNSNSGDLEKSAHKLKGAIANFVDDAAFETALKLEMMGREGRFDGADAVHEILVKEVECLVNALKKCVE